MQGCSVHRLFWRRYLKAALLQAGCRPRLSSASSRSLGARRSSEGQPQWFALRHLASRNANQVHRFDDTAAAADPPTHLLRGLLVLPDLRDCFTETLTPPLPKNRLVPTPADVQRQTICNLQHQRVVDVVADVAADIDR